MVQNIIKDCSIHPRGPDDETLAEPQYQWIEDTLAASKADYIIVAGHYPIYSIAEHGSTADLVKNLMPILQKMCGHDHSFEYINTGDGIDYIDTDGTHVCDSSTAHTNTIPKNSLKFHGCNDGGFTRIGVDYSGLQTINQNIFNELLKITLYKMIQRFHTQYSNGFPFYNDQKRQPSSINSTSKRYNNSKINKLKLAMKTTDVFSLLEHGMNLSYNELKKDCDILMNKFYCNLWDWFFIPMEIWNECPYYKSYEIVRTFDLMNVCHITIGTQLLPLSIKKLLYNKMNREWSLDYNNFMKGTIKRIFYFMKLNDVNKIDVVSLDQIKNNKLWNTFMNDKLDIIPPQDTILQGINI